MERWKGWRDGGGKRWKEDRKVKKNVRKGRWRWRDGGVEEGRNGEKIGGLNGMLVKESGSGEMER